MIVEEPQQRERPRRKPRPQPLTASATVARPAAGTTTDISTAAPMGHRGPRIVRQARVLSWRSPEAVAVVVASFVVSLACFYVTAYARVTAEGFEKAHLSRQLRAAVAERESLEADIRRYSKPDVVERRAGEMGMVVAPPQAMNLLSAPTTR